MKTIIFIDQSSNIREALQTLHDMDADSSLLAHLATRRLSAREQELVLLDTAGFRRRTIAERMHISERTLEGYWRTIYDKTGFPNREALRQWVGSINQDTHKVRQ